MSQKILSSPVILSVAVERETAEQIGATAAGQCTSKSVVLRSLIDTALDAMEPVRRVCGWCGLDMGKGTWLAPVGTVTHGICSECAAKQEAPR